MNWANQYVGLPFADQGRDRNGLDCWGLVRLAYREQLDIHLLSYVDDYVGADERAEVAGLICQEAAAGPWMKVAKPHPMDVLLFRRGRYDSHVGIKVARSRMLHMAQGEQARIEDYTSAKWGKRFVGGYRHVARPLKVR